MTGANVSVYATTFVGLRYMDRCYANMVTSWEVVVYTGAVGKPDCGQMG